MCICIYIYIHICVSISIYLSIYIYIYIYNVSNLSPRRGVDVLTRHVCIIVIVIVIVLVTVIVMVIVIDVRSCSTTEHTSATCVLRHDMCMYNACIPNCASKQCVAYYAATIKRMLRQPVSYRRASWRIRLITLFNLNCREQSAQLCVFSKLLHLITPIYQAVVCVPS